METEDKERKVRGNREETERKSEKKGRKKGRERERERRERERARKGESVRKRR